MESIQITHDGQALVLGTVGQSTYDIKHLLDIIEYVANLATKFNNYKADGKFGFFEKMKFGFDIAQGVEYATQIDVIVKELSDLQENELVQIVQVLGSKFGWDEPGAIRFMQDILFPALTVIRQTLLLATTIPAFFKHTQQ